MGKKLFISSCLAAFLVATLGLPVLAQNTTASATPAKNIMNILKKTTATVNLACMQTAVGKRDTAIISAFDVFYAATKQALETRKTALTSAWGITDKTQRKTALTAAWKVYKDTQKTARQTLNKARKDAWQNFYTDRKACGTSGASEDQGTESMDVNI